MTKCAFTCTMGEEGQELYGKCYTSAEHGLPATEHEYSERLIIENSIKSWHGADV